MDPSEAEAWSGWVLLFWVMEGTLWIIINLFTKTFAFNIYIHVYLVCVVEPTNFASSSGSQNLENL